MNRTEMLLEAIKNYMNLKKEWSGMEIVFDDGRKVEIMCNNKV